MKTILTLALKDLRLMLRDKVAFFFIIFFPLAIAVFFGSVFSGMGGRAHGLEILIVDADATASSKQFIGILQASPELKIEQASREIAEARVRRGERMAFVVLKPGFGAARLRPFFSSAPEIELGIDPSRRMEGALLEGVLMRHAAQGMAASAGLPKFQPLIIQRAAISSHRKGPKNAYDVTFPQGVVWAIVGCVASFAISLVIERTRGTLVRLRMAPIQMSHILAGKALACFCTAATVACGLILISVPLFGVHPQSPALLALAIVCVAFGFSGIMMLLSVFGRTEQAAGGLAWGVMLIMSMTGGGMVPLFAMPAWLQKASDLSPIKWAILSLEGAVWRGFSFQEMLLPCGILLAIGIVCFYAGVRAFRWTQQA